jgi:hypothetical protein
VAVARASVEELYFASWVVVQVQQRMSYFQTLRLSLESEVEVSQSFAGDRNVFLELHRAISLAWSV